MAFADNMALMAEKKKEMRSMIERFEKYLEKKKLQLNTNETKIMRFRKGERRRDRRI